MSKNCKYDLVENNKQENNKIKIQDMFFVTFTDESQ